jgi:hypothetical protein
MEKRQIGANVEGTIEANVLVLRIDLSKELGPSKSGKSTLVASTNGNFTLPDGTKIGVNAYRVGSSEMDTQGIHSAGAR